MANLMSMGPSNIILLQGAAAKIFNNAAIYYKTKILNWSWNTCKVIGHFAFMWSTNQHIKCLDNSSFSAASQQQQQEITIKSSSNGNKKSSNDPSASQDPPLCQVLLQVLDGHDFTEFAYQLLEAGVISLNLLMREAEAQDQSTSLNCCAYSHHRCLRQTDLKPHSWSTFQHCYHTPGINAAFQQL